jgi:ribosome assembly protein 1
VEIQASKPIVPFRETAVRAPGTSLHPSFQSIDFLLFIYIFFLDLPPPKYTPNAPRGTVKASSSQNVVSFTIRAVPMPKEILEFVLDNGRVVGKLRKGIKKAEDSGADVDGDVSVSEPAQVDKSPDYDDEDEDGDDEDGGDAGIVSSLAQLNLQDDQDLEAELDLQGDVARRAGSSSVRPEQFWDKFGEICKVVGGEWAGLEEKVWAFGPRGEGGCLLVDAREGAGQS